MILMSHPQHGLMHVYTDQDKAWNEKNGWSVAEPAMPTVIAAQIDEREALVAAYTEKHGKKPHWKLSDEKLREALK